MYKTLNLNLINNLLHEEASNIYMIRYLTAEGEPLYHSDPIIIETELSSVCIMGRSEQLALSDEWKDPFAVTYVMGNPVYPKDIVGMRSDIGGYYIFKVNDWHEFKPYVNKKIISYDLILDIDNKVVGLVLKFSEISMTFLVVGEECIINPDTIPRGLRIHNNNLQ